LDKRKKDRLDRIEELLNMAAAQTAKNAKEIRPTRREFRDELRASAKLHDREIKEIRALFKKMIQRIAA
jgi:hypothetical protein